MQAQEQEQARQARTQERAKQAKPEQAMRIFF